MKNYEKQAFFTAFSLFFLTLFVFVSITLYMYYQDRLGRMEQAVLHQMREYTFDFEGGTFSLDIVAQDEAKQLFHIYRCPEGLCAYFELPATGPYWLKVIYAQEKVEKAIAVLRQEILKLFGMSVVLVLAIAAGFAAYSLRPMRQALRLLEEFLKDLIHDLNTPATSILLNAKLLRKRGDFEETERIELSASTIASLHNNLQFLHVQRIAKDEEVALDTLVEAHVTLLKKLYPRIVFTLDLDPVRLRSNYNALARIIDNLLTNACKYNRRNGLVHVVLKENTLRIQDTGFGIRDTKRVFERYYKENARGLGIGLAIVKQLCEALGLSLSLSSKPDKGTTVVLTLS